MEKPYKLLALDMDGTLLNGNSEISEENERWIQSAMDAGIAVCLATGRGYQSALPFARQLKLTTPMVLVNGSEVWEEPGKLHSRTLMEPRDIIALRELAVRYGTWYWAYSLDGVYNKNGWPDDEEDRAEWLKFGFYTEDDRARRAVTDAIAGIGHFELTNSHPHNIELNPAGVSKASGLRKVCGMLGLDMSQVVACGDSLNDASMIRDAGLGVAMGNAQEEVKRMADAVTLTNEEDGIAHVIQTYLLSK
jgi:HAD superfamily hydrolase (TIGR01484 family)